MRDAFINAFEKLVGVIVVLMGIVVVGAAAAVTFGGRVNPDVGGGPLVGLLILIGGAIYLIFFGGLMYLGLGIYQNTKRSADALEKLLSK